MSVSQLVQGAVLGFGAFLLHKTYKKAAPAASNSSTLAASKYSDKKVVMEVRSRGLSVPVRSA